MRKVILILLGILIISCDRVLDPEEKEIFQPIYSISFESAEELENWVGITTESIVYSAPADCGIFSVKISGGCIIPHAQYEFTNNLESGIYKIECWNKLLMNGGGVKLYSVDIHGEIKDEVLIEVRDTVWNKKVSDPLFFEAGQTLKIELNSGGLKPGAMLVDELKVLKSSTTN